MDSSGTEAAADTILVLEPIHPAGLELLHEAGPVLQTAPEVGPLSCPDESVVAIVTRGLGQVDRSALERFPNLRAVTRCGAGLDNIDVEAAHARGLAVLYSPGRTTNAVAEQSLMLLLALCRQLVPLSGALEAGDWEARHGSLGRDLKGQRLGIVGLGSIGLRTAELASAFGMEVGYWSRSSTDPRWPSKPLDELLSSSDVVSLHLRLNEETQGFLSRERIASMKPGARLLNTARGALLDKAALLEALDAGDLAGYGADCLDPEPPEPSDPLVRHPRSLITPHSSILTEETYAAMCVDACRALCQLLSGEEIDPTTRWRPG